MGVKVQVLYLICVGLSLALEQKNADEGRPYEFGFTIDGEQHRYEKKDERGIVQGEFGFITADGIYHVTVYATDENGKFKILSMRNIRISAPLDGSPFKGEISPEANKYRKQANLPLLPSPQPSPNALSIPEQVATTTSRIPIKFTTQPTIKPACAGCGYVTTQKPRPGEPTFQFFNPIGQQPLQQQFGVSLTAKNPSLPALQAPVSSQQNLQAGPEQIPQDGFNSQNAPDLSSSVGGAQRPQISNAGSPSNFPQYQPASGPQNTNYRPQGSVQAAQLPGEGNQAQTGDGQTNPYLSGGGEVQNAQYLSGTGENVGGSILENSPQGVSQIGGGQTNPYLSGGDNVQNVQYPSGTGENVGGSILENSPQGVRQIGGGQTNPYLSGGDNVQNAQYPSDTTGNVGGNNLQNRPSVSQGVGQIGEGQNNPYLSGTGGDNLQGNLIHSALLGNGGGSGGSAQENYNQFGGSGLLEGGNIPGTFGNAAGSLQTQGNLLNNLQEPNPLQLPGQGPASGVSTLPPISISDNVIHVGGDKKQDIPIKDKFGGMQDGLPEGIQEGDITNLLYKFHYTVGFHGHYEKGLKNGAKIGGYFVNGRDGISRVVTYIADENGYRPKVKFINLGLDSDETPKAETEKTFGLKSFEFVWYPI